MPGIGEATALVLAITSSLGGRRHEGLASLRAWARTAEHAAQLLAFLLHRCRSQGLLRPVAWAPALHSMWRAGCCLASLRTWAGVA